MRLKKFVMMALMSLLSLSAYADVTVTGIVVEAGDERPYHWSHSGRERAYV